MHHEQHVGETGSEIRSVGVVVSGWLGRVHVHAFRTVEFDHRLAGDVRQTWGNRTNQQRLIHFIKSKSGFRTSYDITFNTDVITSSSRCSGHCIRVLFILLWPRLTDGQHRLVLTVHAWAVTKVSLLILLQLKHKSKSALTPFVCVRTLVIPHCSRTIWAMPRLVRM